MWRDFIRTACVVTFLLANLSLVAQNAQTETEDDDNPFPPCEITVTFKPDIVIELAADTVITLQDIAEITIDTVPEYDITLECIMGHTIIPEGWDGKAPLPFRLGSFTSEEDFYIDIIGALEYDIFEKDTASGNYYSTPTVAHSNSPNYIILHSKITAQNYPKIASICRHTPADPTRGIPERYALDIKLTPWVHKRLTTKPTPERPYPEGIMRIILRGNELHIRNNYWYIECELPEETVDASTHPKFDLIFDRNHEQMLFYWQRQPVFELGKTPSTYNLLDSAEFISTFPITRDYFFYAVDDEHNILLHGLIPKDWCADSPIIVTTRPSEKLSYRKFISIEHFYYATTSDTTSLFDAPKDETQPSLIIPCLGEAHIRRHDERTILYHEPNGFKIPASDNPSDIVDTYITFRLSKPLATDLPIYVNYQPDLKQNFNRRKETEPRTTIDSKIMIIPAGTLSTTLPVRIRTGPPFEGKYRHEYDIYLSAADYPRVYLNESHNNDCYGNEGNFQVPCLSRAVSLTYNDTQRQCFQPAVSLLSSDSPHVLYAGGMLDLRFTLDTTRMNPKAKLKDDIISLSISSDANEDEEVEYYTETSETDGRTVRNRSYVRFGDEMSLRIFASPQLTRERSLTITITDDPSNDYFVKPPSSTTILLKPTKE